MLRIYSFILDVLRKVAAVEGRIRKHDPDLARQLRRAASGIALNCAEATGSQGGNVKARFRSALGSTYETARVSRCRGGLRLRRDRRSATRRSRSHWCDALPPHLVRR